MAVGSLAFAVIGGGLTAATSTGSDLVMGLICLVIMGGCSMLLARQACQRGPAALITSREIASPLQLDVDPHLLAAWADARDTEPQSDAVGGVSPD